MEAGGGRTQGNRVRSPYVCPERFLETLNLRPGSYPSRFHRINHFIDFIILDGRDGKREKLTAQGRLLMEVNQIFIAQKRCRCNKFDESLNLCSETLDKGKVSVIGDEHFLPFPGDEPGRNMHIPLQVFQIIFPKNGKNRCGRIPHSGETL